MFDFPTDPEGIRRRFRPAVLFECRGGWTWTQSCRAGLVFWLTDRPDFPKPAPPDDFDGYATAIGPRVPDRDDPLLLTAVVAAIERELDGVARPVRDWLGCFSNTMSHHVSRVAGGLSLRGTYGPAKGLRQREAHPLRHVLVL